MVWQDYLGVARRNELLENLAKNDEKVKEM
jgi:hypothetical protein